MAARLKQDLGVDAELVRGDRGEFTVWVDDTKVAEKGWVMFPTEDSVVAAVREALAKPA